MYLSACVPVCLFLSECVPVWMTRAFTVFLKVYLCLCAPVYLSVCLSVYLSEFVPVGMTRAFTVFRAVFTMSFSMRRSVSPTRDTERPARPARAVRPTRCT